MLVLVGVKCESEFDRPGEIGIERRQTRQTIALH